MTTMLVTTCHVCGTVISLPRTDRADSGPLNALDEAYASMVVCDACCAALDAEHRQRQIAQVASWCRNNGTITDATERWTFDASRADFEQRNPTAWTVGRELGATGVAGTLWLRGPCGTGKTVLARCILNARLAEGVSVGDLKCKRIEDVAEAAMRQPAEAAVFQRRYSRIGLLLLDDIDNARWTAPGFGMLREIVDLRREVNRPMIVTAQRTSGEMACEATKDHPAGIFRCIPGVERTAVVSLMSRFQPANMITLRGDDLRGLA